MSRLGGGGIQVDKMLREGLRVHVHKSMAEALANALKGNADNNARCKPSHRHDPVNFSQALTGNGDLPLLVERADALIDEVIIHDPRLNRRHGWVRSEEGIDLDPILLAAGEPECCIDRKRVKTADATTGEPARIVISTDSTNDASDKHVVAFIAAARLAQQFRPLEIWWQGAWLEHAYQGEVLLAPLIQGDMDFSRVQFFLSHNERDSLSFRCMWYHACTVPSGGSFKTNRIAHKYGGLRAEYSHLSNTFDFITEKGIPSEPERIAALAAKWAGLPSIWEDAVHGYEASQWWKPANDGPLATETPKEKAEREARWKREDEERERQKKHEADERLKV